MFRIIWDRENNGVKLTSKSSELNLNVAPRPVFYEELDLLGLHKFWSYPKCAEPLLWACDRKYFYRGELIMEVKGGNLYDPPEIILSNLTKKLVLKPINLHTLLDVNKEYMFLLESEAIQFINSTYRQYLKTSKKNNAEHEVDFVELAEKQTKKYKEILAVVKQDCDSFDILPLELANDESKPIYFATNIEIFLASYSGGKDSQVLLDLVTRAIPSDDFVVIYSDTGYELPPSLEIYEKTQTFYQSRYPNMRFYTARNHQKVLDYWEKIGTPSNVYRWCCSVMKTAPLYKLLKNINGFEKQPKTLTFEGVRAEESESRSHYKRIGKGVKHNGVINASPILNWSLTEIFLYIFFHKLPLNVIYRLGFTRAGCIICPFSSPGNDRLSKIFFSDKLDPFLCKITNTVEKSGVKDVEEYIKEGKWKLRAGGRILSNNSNFEIIATSP
ncbi:MAG: phosphoadenosine phosphosulfate reductase family protein, partial [Bacteroidia bacterium]|nr:phosphoadenosine phosphosulfate reductase family protein [Bacteroidia bacterium]